MYIKYFSCIAFNCMLRIFHDFFHHDLQFIQVGICHDLQFIQVGIWHDQQFIQVDLCTPEC